MGDRRRRSRAMQMAQYQASLEIEDAEIINVEAEFANSLMQYEHYAESSYRGSVTRRSFIELFESILNVVVNHDHYFARKIDVVGRQSLSPYQKLTSAFWMLANGCSADSTNEYCQLAETTVIENLKCFCKAIEAIYRVTYLRKPIREDLKRLLHKAYKRGFPGMIGILDCMHWECKNCPTAWAG
ncbi:uncharacterized protein LOC103931059 [Pyrus x bretschneideri]|uniref:uncharacterized protein LOC103931059 n=1 Tax=Pyrus x bretschneideri TaxID=225117 RepID=UPI00202FE3B5|nr:uncharacterized protein LOC103931059 [Pyrus x bretschneideri]